MKLSLILTTILMTYAVRLQTPQVVTLKRFDVIRVNPDDLRRLPSSVRSLFADPVPDGEGVRDLAEATRRAGFTPQLLSGKTPVRVFITNLVNEEVKINVAALREALRAAKVEGVTVPADWDGVVIVLQHQPGILVDYGDFYLAQGAPSTMSTPQGFPLAQALEVMFRVIGISASQARILREQFAANASAFLPIAPRFEMDIRQVPMASSTRLLLQNADKGGELAFMWSAGDRSYFLTGLVSEDQAIAFANSLQ